MSHIHDPCCITKNCSHVHPPTPNDYNQNFLASCLVWPLGLILYCLAIQLILLPEGIKAFQVIPDLCNALYIPYSNSDIPGTCSFTLLSVTHGLSSAVFLRYPCPSLSISSMCCSNRKPVVLWGDSFPYIFFKCHDPWRLSKGFT